MASTARDRWVWKLIESGDIKTLKRMEHKLDNFDFNGRSQEFGTPILAFFESFFLGRGAFSAIWSKTPNEYYAQASELCKWLRFHGADLTAQAPATCEKSLDMAWEREGEVREEGECDDDDDDHSTVVEFANRSPLEVLMDFRWSISEKVASCPRWSTALEACEFLVKEITQCDAAESTKMLIPRFVVEAWETASRDEGSANVSLLCKPTGAKVHAHSMILCAISPVLKAMLASSLKEGILREIEVEDNEQVVSAFVHFCYTGCARAEDLSAAVLVKVLSLAHRWQANDLIPFLCSRLCSILESDMSDLTLIIDATHLMNLAPLRQVCISCLMSQDEVARQEIVSKLSADAQQEINHALGVGEKGAKRRRLLQPL